VFGIRLPRRGPIPAALANTRRIVDRGHKSERGRRCLVLVNDLFPVYNADFLSATTKTVALAKPTRADSRSRACSRGECRRGLLGRGLG
jgi:hypothetical protein